MRSVVILIGLFLFLPACTVRVGPPPQTSSTPSSQEQVSSESSETKEAERETHNVMYRGIVQPAGISIYMQGSHRLVLPDGRFVLLESQTLDLNGYVGEEVELFGSTRPTVEANGIIMNVNEAKLILPSKEEETKESEDAEDPKKAEEKSPPEQPTKPTEPLPLRSSHSSAIGQATAEGVKGGTESPQPLASSTPPEPAVVSADLTAVIEAMAAENFSAEHWTQEYCSSHIGFCIPVHRNWWYKSFGTTTTTLWHIEVGNSPVLNLGDGTITLNLLFGDLSLENQATSEVRIDNDTVVASRPWSGNRHFEIRTHAKLEAAARYMIDHITAYEGN